MIDRERVRTMTKLAIMETREGRDMIKLCSYRKIDYILTEIFKAFVAGTVFYLLGLALWLCYLWDSMNDFIVGLDVMQLLEDIGVRYVIIVGIYILVCALIAARRHKKRSKQRDAYMSYLEELKHSYETDLKARVMRRGRKTDRSSGYRGQEEA